MCKHWNVSKKKDDFDGQGSDVNDDDANDTTLFSLFCRDRIMVVSQNNASSLSSRRRIIVVIIIAEEEDDTIKTAEDGDFEHHQ